MSVGSKDLGLFPGDGGGSAFGCPWGGAGGGIFLANLKNGGFLTVPCGRSPANTAELLAVNVFLLMSDVSCARQTSR